MAQYIDLHTHAPLKHYLFGTEITDDEKPPVDDTLIDLLDLKNLYVSLPGMERGNVGLVWASHYVPERNLVRCAKVLPVIRQLLFAIANETLNKFESPSCPEAPFEQAKQSINDFARHVQDRGAVCPTDVTAMKNALAAGKKVFLHTLEGAHHLGRKRIRNGKPDVQGYLDALQWFRDAGVCSITLGHFFPNDCVAPVNGLPPHVVETLNYPTKFPDTGLSSIGEEVVRWMLDNGMIVDLIHCSPRARQSIFKMNLTRKHPRPLVFSHAGVAEVFKKHADQKYFSDYVLNPSDEEIMLIKRCNGVIGVISDMYWLRGREEKDALLGAIPDPGLSYFIETVKYIHDRTGTYDNIAVGSDFDGFTNVLDDFPDASCMPVLAQTLNEAGIPSGDVDKIMSLNALRVLEEEWGR